PAPAPHLGPAGQTAVAPNPTAPTRPTRPGDRCATTSSTTRAPCSRHGRGSKRTRWPRPRAWVYRWPSRCSTSRAAWTWLSGLHAAFDPIFLLFSAASADSAASAVEKESGLGVGRGQQPLQRPVGRPVDHAGQEG